MTVNALRVPLLGVIVGRLAGASVKVSVMVAVSPMFKALSSVVMLTVGATVSTATVAAAKVLPVLPAASAQLPAVKLIVPAAVLAGGVSVAV